MMRMTIPHDETDQRKQCSFSNPDSERIEEAMDRCRYGSPTREDILVVLGVASDYLHMTTYELGQEHCVGQLRAIWRARRAREKAADHG
jgi:hypothetical protein